MRRFILGFAATAAIAAPLALGSAANAYTMDGTGKGFVGKGEVQSAFGWNNATMQTNHTSITFSTTQAATQAHSQTATQALSQSLTQSASQAGTQSASQSASQTGTQTATQGVTE